jgi:hypothetical protein
MGHTFYSKFVPVHMVSFSDFQMILENEIYTYQKINSQAIPFLVCP